MSMQKLVGRVFVSRRAVSMALRLLLLVAVASPAIPALAAADHLVIVLPGQSLSATGGIVGTPDPVVARGRFRVEVYAIDAFGNIAADYQGRVAIPVLPSQPPGQGPPLAARRYGTLISRLGAATSIPAAGGSLRISLGGGPFQEIALASAANPAQVCQSIVNGVHSLPLESFAAGPFGFGCMPSGGALGVRYTMFLDSGTPVRATVSLLTAGASRASDASSIMIDPSYGSAPALHLGAPVPSSDPSEGDEYAERLPAEPTGADQRFSRGIAFFEVSVTSLDAVGPNQTFSVDQGTGPVLPVVSTPVTILPGSLGVVTATALGDGTGRMTRVRVTYGRKIDPTTLGSVHPEDFAILEPGTSIPGTSMQSSTTTEFGYEATSIEVTFGTGLGRTDLTNVELRYTPPSSGSPLPPLSMTPTSEPPLIDGAPPVLVSAFAQDIDGNGGLDRMKFFFSEPVGFSAGTGVSVSGFNPATDTTSIAVPVPFDLSLRSVGLVTDDITVTVTDPHNPAATSITGADAIAEAITDAVRWDALHRPAFNNFTCTFTNGRYVLRAGVPLRFESGMYVQDSPIPGGGPPPALRLGPQNGGVERPGYGDATTTLPESLLTVRSQGGANLLLGKTASDLTVAGSTISVNLTNVPNSGTAQPSFVWRDDGDRGFIVDRNPTPNNNLGFNNIGLPPDFHPVRLLREAASSSSSADLAMVRTVAAGDVLLDGSPSTLPLNASSPETAASFIWRQVSGPPVTIDPVSPGVATVRPLQAGTYTFELVVTDSIGLASFNLYTNADGTLSRPLVLTVVPGPQMRSVVLLPGRSLVPGTESTDEVVAGTAKVATEGSPYVVRVVTTDDFFNEVPAPPGALVRLVTTDPGDVEPPLQPFVGSTSTFTLTPSHAATSMTPEVDDEVLNAFEHGDIHYPYVVGRLWDAHPLPPLPGQQGVARFGWTPDPRAVRWNIYRASLSSLADIDGDGIPDLGYGACAPDSDATDTTYEDATMPLPGSGFMYAGTESLVVDGVVQEAGLGRAGSGQERPNYSPCP